MRRAEIDYILTTMLESFGNISDLNITVGKPFQVETSGELVEVPIDFRFTKITPFQAEIIAMNLLNNDRRLLETLFREGSCDLSYLVMGKARFRVNIFSQQGNFSLAMRKLESRIPTFAELHLPENFAKIAEEKNGLVLVTGATGSGKSTTLAAILNKLNEEKAIHIVTLEDPVEFLHPQKSATFRSEERRVGKECRSRWSPEQ